MAAHSYYSGDSHLHFSRQTEADDQVILDLPEAKDIHFGSIDPRQLDQSLAPGHQPSGSIDGNHSRTGQPQSLDIGTLPGLIEPDD